LSPYEHEKLATEPTASFRLSADAERRRHGQAKKTKCRERYGGETPCCQPGLGGDEILQGGIWADWH
jgi:hypothetical protein